MDGEGIIGTWKGRPISASMSKKELLDIIRKMMAIITQEQESRIENPVRPGDIIGGLDKSTGLWKD